MKSCFVCVCVALDKSQSGTPIWFRAVASQAQDFAPFHEFYASQLQNGRALSRLMGLDVTVVAFHPDCTQAEYREGSRVQKLQSLASFIHDRQRPQ